jgi:hypothetical protein
MALSFYIWKSIVTGYITLKNPPIDTVGKNASENDANSSNDIVCRLPESDFVKVMYWKSTKEIWDKIQNILKGDDKVMKAKLQTHRR